MNPATEAAGPCVNKKLGGGLSANHSSKILKIYFNKIIFLEFIKDPDCIL